MADTGVSSEYQIHSLSLQCSIAYKLKEKPIKGLTGNKELTVTRLSNKHKAMLNFKYLVRTSWLL